MADLMTKLNLSDSWLLEDFAQLLAIHNSEVGDVSFFANLIYLAKKSSKLIPINWNSYDKYLLFNPNDLIKWATEKRLTLPEFGEKNYLWTGFDPDDENYSPELDIANQIWRLIVSQRDPNLTFRQQAVNLLKDPKYDLTPDAQNRIASVVNTAERKKGGCK